MKIEDFQLRMQSKYEHETTISTSFESELQSEYAERSRQLLETMEYEKRLRSQMHLVLIRQFLQQLHSGFKTLEPLNIPTQESSEVLHVKEQRSEYQALNIAMQGFIQTDTQKISIDINVAMSHTLITERNFETSNFIDPLIINFDGEMPTLSDTSFHFDIDNNGSSDQVSLLNQGNGFLALDSDENGTIDAGSELFGTVLGNGFAELSLFDDDNNLWIDANDPILDKLRIWVKNEDQDELLSLGEVGIGAIYLGSTRSEFHYKNQEQSLGQLRSSGLFLHESGHSGIIAQIDLAKQKAVDNPVKSTEPLLANLIQQEV
ncbi:MAG: hypothetical protein U9N52_03325 [Campylobacterota bacterium]|nr:hypothetical protein [Campylobacterota bacterium]